MSKKYSRQYIAEHGIGAILVFEYLYFLLQAQHGRHNLQESLTLAVKEYKRSGIHARVNESIQETFEKYGDNVDILCPILVDIAKENQLSKMLSTKDLLCPNSYTFHLNLLLSGLQVVLLISSIIVACLIGYHVINTSTPVANSWYLTYQLLT
ncbi:hypothetical protein F5141DRAFT_633091 [Pisolithus sp. B1]|nr:hypothetical protein F5141DRAFT_633091 [Pisolithus sp. B1]